MQGSQAHGVPSAPNPLAFSASTLGGQTPAAADNTPPDLLAALNALALVSNSPSGGSSPSIAESSSRANVASALQARDSGGAELTLGAQLEDNDDDDVWNSFGAVNARLDMISQTCDENLGAVRAELFRSIKATSGACLKLFSTKMHLDRATLAHPQTIQLLSEVMHPVVEQSVSRSFQEKSAAFLGAVGSLNASCTVMDGEIAKLKSRLCSVESFDLHKDALGIELENMIDTAVDDQLEEARERLEKCGSKLRAKMGQLTQGCTDVMASAKQMVAKAAQDERTALNAEMQAFGQAREELVRNAKQMVVGAIEDGRAELRTELRALKQQCEAVGAELQALKQSRAALGGDQHRAELETSMKQLVVAAIQNERAAFGAELQALKQERKDLETSMKQMIASATQNERAALDAELQALKQERKDLETSMKQMIASATQNERAALDAELQALKQERKELETSMKQMIDSATQNERMKQMIASATQNERAALNAELQALKQERKELETSMKQMIASATQNERAALNAELQALKQERATMAASAKQRVDGTTQDERAAFGNELQALKQERTELEANVKQMIASATQNERAALNAELQALKQERETMVASAKQRVDDTTQHERAAFGNELHALKQKFEAVGAELQALKKQNCTALGSEQHHAETKAAIQERVTGLENCVQQMIATAAQKERSALVKTFGEDLAQVKEQLIVHMRHSLAASKQPEAAAGASVGVTEQLNEVRAAQMRFAEGLAAVRKSSTDDAESMRQLVEHRTTLFQMYETLKQQHDALSDAKDKFQDINSWRLNMEGVVEKVVLHLQGHLPSRDAVLEAHDTMLAALRVEAAKSHEKHQQADEERTRMAMAREKTAAATRVQADLEQKVSEHAKAQTKLELQVADVRKSHEKEQADMNQRLDSVRRELAKAADLRINQTDAHSDLERRVKSVHRELAEGQAKVHADLERRVESVYHELDKTTKTTRSCLGKRLDAQRDEQNRRWKFLEPAVKKHRKVLRTHRIALQELRSSASEHYHTLMRVAGNAAPSKLNSLLNLGAPTRGTLSPQEAQLQGHCS